jgi:hypothetical protein
MPAAFAKMVFKFSSLKIEKRKAFGQPQQYVLKN